MFTSGDWGADFLLVSYIPLDFTAELTLVDELGRTKIFCVLELVFGFLYCYIIFIEESLFIIKLAFLSATFP